MKLAKVQKAQDIKKELEKHADLIPDQGVKEQVLENKNLRMKEEE